jgi:transposase
MTLAEPPGEATHWTGLAMAKAAGISHRSVQRIWAAHGLQPHRIKTFKLSTDPKFAAESGKMRNGIEVRLGPGDRERLEAIVGSRNSRQKYVWRARIVLLSAAGIGTMAIQRQTGKSKPTIWRWQARFMAEGVDGLLRDATRPAGKPPLSPATIERVVEMTLAEPPGEATHWTGLAMAKAAGISHRSVQRIWAAHGLQPHRIKTFKLSTDPKFAAKLQDIVGLYIDPPEHALVLSVDEKSQIQALDRTQRGLPMKRGRCGTMTHEYKRHGTTTLFAALDVLEGRLIGQCMARHRHQEFIRFLNKINRETPAERELHLIVDNYATHKHPKVHAWVERHPRFHFHFTPTSASWLNAVERFFAKLTRQRLKRGVFTGIVDLQAAINRFLVETNQNPKPFTWTADPDAINNRFRTPQQPLRLGGGNRSSCPFPAIRSPIRNDPVGWKVAVRPAFRKWLCRAIIHAQRRIEGWG